jgi:hypothetical protein
MTQPLFHTLDEFIEKTAGEVNLPDDPNQWAQSILQELYKQVPYITDYQPHVQMQRVDAERGYGLGHVEIQNQTEAPMNTDPEMLEATGVRTVRIPFVIKEKKLSPFDLLVNDMGKMLPLTENRLRQALFRPQAFDVTSRTPGDQSMIGQLYPPYRQNYGFGGGGISMNASGGMGMGKVGSALENFLDPDAKTASKAPPQPLPKKRGFTKSAGSLLSNILPTITSADHQRFTDELQKSASYLYANASLSCDSFNDILGAIVNTEPSMEKAGSWKAWLPTSVAQVRRTSDGYAVKTASHHIWDPDEEIVDRGEVVRRFGVKVAMDADTSGAVTVSDQEGVTGEESLNEIAPVTKPGFYKVKETTGKEHIGYVVPSLIDLSGELVPIALFTNGSVVAVQGEIWGEDVGEGTELPSGPVGNDGAFYQMGEDGIEMTVPFNFQDSYTFGTQPKVFRGTTFDGRPSEVSVQPNLAGVTPVDNGRVLVPEDWNWLPLDGVDTVVLVGGEEADSLDPMDKASCVHVRSDGDSFSFEGVPLAKLGAAQTQWLALDDAMFLLAGLGVNQEHGVKKLAEAAAFKAPQSIRIGRVIEDGATHIKESMARAAELVEGMSAFKQPILLKEATTFPDPTTVDTVLSLGFINPENVLSFVGYLPDLEDVQTKLCELLFSVRIGLKNIPQSALERAIRSLEETIEGLKVLGFQGS